MELHKEKFQAKEDAIQAISGSMTSRIVLFHIYYFRVTARRARGEEHRERRELRARARARSRGRGGTGCVPPSVDVRAPASRSTRGVTVKGRGRVVKGAATRRELVDGWDSILFAAALLQTSVLRFRSSGENAALGHRRAGRTGGSGSAGARGGFRAVPAPRHQRDAGGHRGPHPGARAGVHAEQEQVVGDGQYAHPDQDAGGGLGGERPEPSAESERRGRGQARQTVREGRGESQGDREDGRDAGGAGAADREERVVVNAGGGLQPMDSGQLMEIG